MTTADYYKQIVDEKNSIHPTLDNLTMVNNEQDLLSNLTTTSKVAEHNLWAWIIARSMSVLQSLFDALKLDVAILMDNKEPGTVGWYKYMLLQFQLGYQLYWQTSKNRFDYNDTTSPTALAAKIIAFCAIDDTTGVVKVKVAKKDSSTGLPVKLDVITEFPQVEAYLNQKKLAGTRISLISEDADMLKVIGNILYNPLYDASLLQVNVEAAINEFNKLLPFNGTYNINKLIDAIQSVPGVYDVRLSNVSYKYGAYAYTTIIGEYKTVAGYVKIDPANALSTTLTYVKYV
jgi:hypothetical protein